MKVTAVITGDDLTRRIRFHGETSADNEVLGEIEGLKVILEDVFFDLNKVEDQTYGRQEYSAEQIHNSITSLKKELIENYFDMEE